ncbi:MFS general substrate transporter [Karstenula rhodostoma CBS 690.94]|uniref:MFS general substrate transporter n=1 Tax=Karstenula rhodostoma CBS 690.94 TaxID=1392251 RepID=A0A9P4P3M6_9PLEO|nr:MFS general substrate transporter [Karstenula rhodostoma CBS 690.94]
MWSPQEHQAADSASTMNTGIKEDLTVDLAAGKGEEHAVDSGGINAADEVKGLKLALIIFGLCFSNILTGLDFTLIATAIPVITSDFDSLGDIYMFFPKKFVYIAYIGMFEIGSLVCALAPNSDALIVGRAISGLGASGIFAGSLIIVATIAPLHKRPLLTGLTNGTFGASQIIGPLIGGAFAQNVTWRWCFWINLPAGGVSIALILLFLHVQKNPTEMGALKTKIKNLDLLGFTIFAGAILMLLLALQWGGVTHAWSSSVIIGLLVGFGVVFAIFVASQWWMADSALMPPKLFTFRTVVLAFGACLLGPGGVATIIYYLPIWFQAVQGATPINSGVRYLPSVISDVLTSIVGGGIVMTVGWYNPFYIFGVGILAIGSGLLSTLTPTTSAGKWIGYQILTGCGYSFMVTMPHIALQATLPPDLIPIASTTLLFAMTASCSIFLAGGQAIFQTALTRNLRRVVSAEEAARLIAVGAADVHREVQPIDRDAVIEVYNKAITNVFYLAAGSAAVAFVFVCGIRWKNIKAKPQSQNAEAKAEAGAEENSSSGAASG